MAAAVRSCPACAAPAHPDQRYCLQCGARVGERRLDPLALLRATERPVAALPPSSRAPRAWQSWSPRTLGASCLGLLLGGALLGAAFAPGPARSLAASAGQIVVVTSPVAPDADGSSDGGGPTASFAPSRPPAPAPAPAPAPVPPPAAAPPFVPEPIAPSPVPEAPAKPEPPAPAKPSIGHVYLVVVPGGPGAEAAFAEDAPAGYLRDELVPKGQLLSGFEPISDDPLTNRIALVSGQDSNADFPPETKMLADQLSTWNLDWRAYVEGMEEPCRHPDELDPFVYFHSVVDRADCAQHVLPLDQLDPKPLFSFVAPAAADRLESWVAPILDSKPYKKDGLLLVMFDAAPQALVLSPFVEAGTTNDKPYDQYSLLRTIEDRIGLGEHLGHADDEDVHALGKDVFDRELDPFQDPEGP